MAKKKGGRHPTAGGCDPLLCLRDLQVKVEDLINQMEDTLETSSTSMPALRKQIEDLERAWSMYEAQ